MILKSPASRGFFVQRYLLNVYSVLQYMQENDNKP